MEQATNTILVDLTEAYGLIAVSGPDAQTFLQGQLTCDVREITETKSSLGAYCNQKGRIIALFRMIKMFDSYLLLLPSGLVARTCTELKKYAMFSKVAIDDVSEQWQKIGILSSDANVAHPAQSYPVFSIPGPHPRWIRLIPSAEAKKDLDYKDFVYWQLLNIQEGIPEVWPETSEQFLPHSLNLPALNAVSFKKGCYRGQEIIARMEYRATLKRRLIQMTLNLDQVPSPGTKLYPRDSAENTVVGSVVSASRSPDNTVLLLIESTEENVRLGTY